MTEQCPCPCFVLFWVFCLFVCLLWLFSFVSFWVCVWVFFFVLFLAGWGVGLVFTHNFLVILFLADGQLATK